MKPNSITQSDTTLKFDGAERESTGRVNQKMHTNQWSGHMNDGREVNFGRGPTKGNMGCGKPGQPGATKSVTQDTYRDTPSSRTVPAMPAQGSVRDNINRGAQVRTPGGTRDWMPSAGQNYHGNPDRIRMGQTGGPSYGATTKGSRPSTSAGSVDFNFGPKKQY
jgi:hypothetical protein